jgi:chemotaxis protein methyltransferase CheR
MQRPAITDAEFAQFQRFIFDAAGITMSSAKKALVSGRLARRLDHCGVSSYGDYFRILSSGSAAPEVQAAIDLLTTNETYFFREPKHFALLRERALAARGRAHPFRVWSAACSSGEEVYSIAMVLADCLGTGSVANTGAAAATPWEVMGSDISTRVLQKARHGHYPMERASHIPRDYLHKFCRKGIGKEEGTMLVERSLRQRVGFAQINLNTALPELGSYDLVFLRNVMIYFSGDTKREVVGRIANTLKPDGSLIIGHSESLNDISDAVVPVAPSIYRKRTEYGRA